MIQNFKLDQAKDLQHNPTKQTDLIQKHQLISFLYFIKTSDPNFPSKFPTIVPQSLPFLSPIVFWNAHFWNNGNLGFPATICFLNFPY